MFISFACLRKTSIYNGVYKHTELHTHDNDAPMTQYSTTIREFETAYRSAILDYTKNHMTSRERTVFDAIVSQCRGSKKQFSNESMAAAVDIVGHTVNRTVVDVEQIINQCRNLDPEGWMVYKCNFVEDYMNKLSHCIDYSENYDDALCLCQIDDATLSGIVICPGISRARYISCIMEYTPTPLECTKISQLPGPLALAQQNQHAVDEKHGKSDTPSSIDDAELMLRCISGCDANGWLLHKHLFIKREQAAAMQQEASPIQQPSSIFTPLESSLSSAITHVLHRVQSDMQIEISLHCAVRLPGNLKVAIH